MSHSTGDVGSVTKVQVGLLRLQCGIQHYAWGDPSYIPQLTGVDNSLGKPYAELWMGDHPDLPASLDGSTSLPALIAADPKQILGSAIVDRFGPQLPYLFKILAVASPLSIQAHPSKSKAKAGFEQEDAIGVPRDASTRTYRDVNHKPELITALTDFYALRGFRPLDELRELLVTVPEFRGLATGFKSTKDALRNLYRKFMEFDEQQVDSVLGPLVERLKIREALRPFELEEREYWVLKSHRAHSCERHYDRGLFSIYLLNLIHLHAGQATYLPAGVLHAYLHGVGVELMANSNNVLRGGLTSKHVDVPELLQSITFDEETPVFVDPIALSATEAAYRTPFEEFELRRIQLSDSLSHESSSACGAEILIVIAADETGVTARVTGSTTGDSVTLAQGQILLATHSTSYSLTANSAATLYKATVPT